MKLVDFIKKKMYGSYKLTSGGEEWTFEIPKLMNNTVFHKSAQVTPIAVRNLLNRLIPIAKHIASSEELYKAIFNNFISVYIRNIHLTFFRERP